MGYRRDFTDLREQRRASRKNTARKVIQGITYSLVVVALLLLAFACICAINGGSIEFAALQWTTKGSIQAACIVAFAAIIAHFGGLPMIKKYKNTKTK